MASNSFGRSKNANNIINKYPTKPNKPTGIPKNNEMGPDATASQFTLEEILQIESNNSLYEVTIDNIDDEKQPITKKINPISNATRVVIKIVAEKKLMVILIP